MIVNPAPTLTLYVSQPFDNSIKVIDVDTGGPAGNEVFIPGATRVLRSRALDQPVDLAPVSIETDNPNQSSNTTMKPGTDFYVCNRGNDTIVRMTQSGQLVAVRTVRADGRPSVGPPERDLHRIRRIAALGHLRRQAARLRRPVRGRARTPRLLADRTGRSLDRLARSGSGTRQTHRARGCSVFQRAHCAELTLHGQVIPDDLLLCRKLLVGHQGDADVPSREATRSTRRGQRPTLRNDPGVPNVVLESGPPSASEIAGSWATFGARRRATFALQADVRIG